MFRPVSLVAVVAVREMTPQVLERRSRREGRRLCRCRLRRPCDELQAEEEEHGARSQRMAGLAAKQVACAGPLDRAAGITAGAMLPR